MKYSKSILIFLFLSSTTSAFYYGLKRTNGNVYQSIMFTIHYLLLNASERASYETNLCSPHGSDGIIIVDITKRN